MAAVNTLGDKVTTPRMPGELAVARVAYFVAGVALLAGNAISYLIPDPYSTGSGQTYPALLGLLVPFVLMVLAVMVRGGGNGVRVTLTVLSALFGLASVSMALDVRPGDGIGGAIAGAAMFGLFATAVVLHYLPRSNAYVRAVRGTR
jgi:hypothetical protein